MPLASTLVSLAAGSLAGVLLAVACPSPAGAKESPPVTEAPPPRDTRLDWWRDARFGMFIHWGPVSLKGTEIGWSRTAEVPAAEYDNLYKRFNPTRYDAKAWVTTAKSAGMKYIVLVAKHHDGFAMWDSKLSDYTISNTPYQRDIVRQMADECRRQGIKFCVYYSVLDWRHPDYPLGEAPGGGPKPSPDMDRYAAYMKGQLKELITGYGPLGILWFDGEWEKPWSIERGLDLQRYVRSLQPDVIINDRVGQGRDGRAGDYATPEQTIGRFNRSQPWESCITLCTQWSWKPDDTMKPLSECVRTLVMCAGGDGNLLLNVGPMPSGEIEPRQVERLEEMGAWLRKYGKSVYGTRGGPFMPSKTGASTCRGNTVYLHVFQWPSGTLRLSPLPAKVIRSRVLTSGKCAVTQTEAGIEVSVRPGDVQEIDTIIALDLDADAEALAPVRWSPSSSLAEGKPSTASNVYQNDAQYGPASAVDGDDTTRWATDTGTKSCWLQVDLGQQVAFNRLVVSEWSPRVRRFELLFRDDETQPWKTALTGTTLGADFSATFPEVTGRYVRLNILDATDGPTLYEMEIGKVDR